MDLDIYQKKFDTSKMLSYIDGEIQKFIGGEIKI